MDVLKPRTLQAVLAIAAWQIGISEYPANSNKVKYNAWFYGKDVAGSAYPWCVTFVQWIFNEAGFALYKTASCGALLARYKQYAPGQVVYNNFLPGDLVLFDFNGTKKATTHIGIVESVAANGKSVVTIEGNTSSTNNANGGSVMRRTRSTSLITAAIRPNYTR